MPGWRQQEPCTNAMHVYTVAADHDADALVVLHLTGTE